MTLTGYFFPLQYNDLMFAAYVVLAEVVLIVVWGLPDSPESIYGVSFSCCVAIFFSSRFFANLLANGVPSFSYVWSASKAACSSAGRKAWIYVLSIMRRGA